MRPKRPLASSVVPGSFPVGQPTHSHDRQRPTSRAEPGWSRARAGPLTRGLVSVLCALSAACGEPEPPAAGPANPASGLRVISLSPAGSAFALDLGAGSSLIAVDPESARLAGLGSLPTVTLEDASELRPDLLLVPPVGPEDPSILTRLRAAGSDVIEIAPEDYDDVFALCRGLGARLAGPVRAAAFESRLGRELGALAATSHGQRRPRVAAVLTLEPLELAAAHSFATDLIELAGGTSTSHDHEGTKPPTRLAELVASAPDLVLLLSPTPRSEAARASARSLLADALPSEFFAFDPASFWVRDGPATVGRLRALIEPLSKAGGAEPLARADRNATAPASGRAAPTLEQLANTRVAGVFEHEVALRDGHYEGEPFLPGGASRPRLEWIREPVVIVDLDDDGHEEAVVLLVASSGGSGSMRHLAVIGMRAGEATSLATVLLGDRVQVRSLDAGEGRIRLELVEHGPGDPACCPTRRSVREWRLETGASWQLVETRSLALEAALSDAPGIAEAGASSAADPAPHAPMRRLRGQLVLGHEVRSFVPCGSERALWVVDRTGSELGSTYRALTTQPYEALYVELRGREAPALDEGFGADYDGSLIALELRRAARETAGCDEDQAGLEFVARGNEPFWRIEIRAGGMRLTELGAAGPLELRRPEARSSGAMRTYLTRGGRTAGPIELSLTEHPCHDSMSGERLPYTAELRLDGRVLSGCALEGPG